MPQNTQGDKRAELYFWLLVFAVILALAWINQFFPLQAN